MCLGHMGRGGSAPEVFYRRYSVPCAEVLVLITLGVCWTPIADLPLVPNPDTEILDPPSRSQLFDKPARLLATTGPSL
jgi:hypothetical protein